MNIFRLAGDMTHLLSFLVRAACAAFAALHQQRAPADAQPACAGAAAQDSRHEVVRWCASSRAAACAVKMQNVALCCTPLSCAAQRTWPQPARARIGSHACALFCAVRRTAHADPDCPAHLQACRCARKSCTRWCSCADTWTCSLASSRCACCAARVAHTRTAADTTHPGFMQVQHGDEDYFHQRNAEHHLVHAEAPAGEPDIQQRGGHVQA